MATAKFCLIFLWLIGDQGPSERELFDRAKSYADKMAYSESEKTLQRLIEGYPNSPLIDAYYASMYSVLKFQLDNARSELLESKKRASKNPPGDRKEKGIVELEIRKPVGLERSLQERIVRYATQYNAKYPNGDLQGQSKKELLMAYAGLNETRHRKVAKDLLHSKDEESKVWSRTFLAIYAIEDRSFVEALQYYMELFDLAEDDNERAKLSLYIANCHYELNQFDKAIASLEKVRSLENRSDRRFFSNMADSWRSYLLKKRDGAKVPPRHFVIVKIER